MRNVIGLIILLTFLLKTSPAQTIQRVEPPNWWIGMHHSTIQLLIYGQKISALTPQIQSDDVSLERTIRVENPNYLFLSLTINPQAKAGKVPIQFFEGEVLVEKVDFELKEREPGRAEIEGFDPSDVMYLITPDRFANGDPSNDNITGMKEAANRAYKGGRHGGDLKGISDHLDYIADLGFTAIWMNPLLENDMPRYSYHGYAATDFYQIDSRFGTNEAYKAFCEAARAKGIKVIMDMILNHSGSEHWFVLDPPTADWINSQGNFHQTTHRRQVNQDIHASEYDKRGFSDGWFVKTMPDLNQRNELMGQYLLQNTIWWIEYTGISGIRMDTYPYPDKDYMSKWTCAVMTEYPNFGIVGEEWSLNPALVAYWQKDKVNHDGYISCLPSVMDFPIQDAIIKGLTESEDWNSGLIKPYEMLATDFLYADPDKLVIFPDNHDMDRLFTQVKGDFDLFKMAMVYFATMRGIPQFYYGTEILMDSNTEPGDHGIIRSDFPGGWPQDAVNAFTGEGLSARQKNALSFTKKLLNWRKTQAAIHHGKLIQFAPEKGIYAYVRMYGGEKVLVIFNKNAEETPLSLTKFAEVLQGDTEARDVLNAKTVLLSEDLILAPKSALILEISPN